MNNGCEASDVNQDDYLLLRLRRLLRLLRLQRIQRLLRLLQRAKVDSQHSSKVAREGGGECDRLMKLEKENPLLVNSCCKAARDTGATFCHHLWVFVVRRLSYPRRFLFVC
jgi:hypothetical protein